MKTFDKVLIAGVLVAAGWMVWTRSENEAKSPIDWQPYSPQAVAQAAGRPVLIDFWATWCGPCREMERTTYRDQRVVELSAQFVMLKADLTQQHTPAVVNLARKFGIRSIPTSVFLGTNGVELTGLRQVRRVGPDEFLALMQEALRHPVTPADHAAPVVDEDIPPRVLPAF